MSEYITVKSKHRTIQVLGRPGARLDHLIALADALAPIYRAHKIYSIKALRAGGDAVVSATIEQTGPDQAHYQEGLGLNAAMFLLEERAA